MSEQIQKIVRKDMSEEILGIPRKLVDLTEQNHKVLINIQGIPRKFMDS